MEGAFSPIVKKIAGEVVGKKQRDFRAPTDVSNRNVCNSFSFQFQAW